MNQIKTESLKNNLMVRSSAINVVIKPIGLILSLIYTPILLSYLGQEKYGIWVTILSVVNWINYFDIGIGNGLRNILTKELTNEQYDKAKKAVSTGYVCLTFIMGIILLILLMATFVLDWGKILNTKINIDIPLLISFVFICINFIMGLCNTLLYALQKSEIVSIQSLIMQLINIAGVLVLRVFTKEDLVYMAILFGASTFVTRLITSIRLFRKNTYIIPSVKFYDKQYTKEISSLGLKFFVAQIAALVLYTTDNLMVSHLFGASEVTPFSLADKVFNTGYMVLATIMIPFWSKTTQEVEKGNYSLVKKYFNRLNGLAILFSVACVFVAIIFRPFMKIWLNHDLVFSNSLIVIMCFYYVIYAFCGVSSPFINGMGGVNGAMILGIIQSVLNIPLSFLFAKTLNMGVVGIRLGTLVVVLIGAIFQFFYFYYLIEKHKKNRECFKG